jgi:hypothetical protein
VFIAVDGLICLAGQPSYLAAFLIISAVLALPAVFFFLRFLVQRGLELELTELPLAPGRSVRAALCSRRPLRPERLACELRCTSYTARATGQPDMGQYTYKVVYSCSVEVAKVVTGLPSGGTALLVHLDIPDDAQDSGFAADGMRGSTWSLLVSVRKLPWLPPVKFVLPVYKVEDAAITQTCVPYWDQNSLA